MKDFQDRVFSYDPGSNCSDLLATQMAAALEEQGHKKKRGKKSKKKQKKLVKQLRQQLTEMKHERRKLKKRIRCKKGGKKMKKQLRALEKELEQLEQLLYSAMYQSQVSAIKPQLKPWWQDAMTVSIPKVLDLALAYESRRQLKAQPSLALQSQSLRALPPHLDRK